MPDPLILVCAACDVPEAFFQNPSVALMPVQLRMRAGDLLDKRLQAATLAFYSTLAARGPREGYSEPLEVEDIASFLRGILLAQPHPVLALLVAGARSTQVTRMKQAAASLDEPSAAGGRARVQVVDSGNLLAGYAVQALDLLDQRTKATDWPSLQRRIARNTERTHTYLVPEGLQFIAHHGRPRGDRSTPWQARVAASVFGITPILHGHRNQTRMVAKRVGAERTRELLFAKVRAVMRLGRLTSPHVAVSFGGDLSEVELMPGYQRLVSEGRDHGVTVHLAQMSMANAMNVGPRALSVGFIAHQDSDVSFYSQYD